MNKITLDNFACVREWSVLPLDCLAPSFTRDERLVVCRFENKELKEIPLAPSSPQSASFQIASSLFRTGPTVIHWVHKSSFPSHSHVHFQDLLLTSSIPLSIWFSKGSHRRCTSLSFTFGGLQRALQSSHQHIPASRISMSMGPTKVTESRSV